MSERTEQEIRDVLPLYALGLLEPAEAHAVDEHLESGCPFCKRELRALAEVAGEIPYNFRTVVPPPRLRERVMASIAATPEPARVGSVAAGLEQPLPGVFVLKDGAGEWRRSPFPGVTYKVLCFDPETNSATSLLRMDPGATYPAHRHAGCEQCLVLEGDVRLGTVSVSKGDFEYAMSGTEHGSVSTDNGCLLLIIANQQDEVFA